MAMLLEEIERLAEQSHVRLGEIKPLAVEADPLSKRHSLDVQFECTLEEWVDFVTRIERSPSLYQVVRAGLSIQDEAPDRLTASLRVASKSVKARETTTPAGLGGGNVATATP
jgi:hypothetical protein